MNVEKSKLIHWNPHSSHFNHFVVVSSSLRLYEIHSADQPGKLDSVQVLPANSASTDAAAPISQSPVSPHAASLVDSGESKETERGIIFSQSSPGSAASALSTSPNSSSSRSFRLLDTITYPQQSIKCVSWSLDSRDPMLIGGGLLSGRLVLMKFMDDLKVVKEFIPRYARACHVVAWNPIHTQQIAVGLDRVRNGCGTLIWDLNQRGTMQSSATPAPIGGTAAPIVAASSPNSFSINANRPIESVSEPLGRVSNSEATLALSWLPNDPFSLAVGTGFKWLRIYDIRGNSNSSRPISVVAHSKSVFGVKFEPFNPNRLATHSEDGIVKLWDLRSLRGPVFSLHTSGSKAIRSKPLLEMEWCATTPSLLSTIAKDDDFLRLWDMSGSLPNELSEIERLSQLNETGATEIPPSRKHSSPSGALSALSWHPSVKQRLLTITSSGIVEDLSFHDNVPVTWTPDNLFSFAVNENAFIGQRQKMPEHIAQAPSSSPLDSDIASVMKWRAQRGYALDSTVNERICHDLGDSSLTALWKQIVPDCFGSGKALHRPGIAEALNEASTSAEGQPNSPEPLDGDCSPNVYKVFNSSQRTEILRRCGWFACVGAKATPARREFESALKALEDAGQFERAAFLALFHLDLRRALTSLTAGADLGLVAMALSGYASFSSGIQAQNASTESISLWSRSWFATLQQEKMSRYLRAIFSFLSASANKPGVINYRAVLDESGLELADRIGFACRFLPDGELQQWLGQAVKSCLDSGDLSALLLTGIGSKDCVELLQSFLDRSSDIQTVAVLSSFAQAASLIANPSADPDPRLNQWITLYRSMLNQWRLWSDRAKFDIARAVLHSQLNEMAAELSSPSQAAVQSQAAQSTRSTKSKSLLSLRPQVYARCNFCGQSLKLSNEAATSSKPGQSRGAGGFRPRARIGAAKTAGPEGASTRVKGCPSCSKSLPRCSLCLVALDAAIPGPISTGASGSTLSRLTPSGMKRNVSGSSIASAASEEKQDIQPLSPDNPQFDNSSMNNYDGWFTWCMRCRHGGHAEHIDNWFNSHDTCPVTDCQCRCRKVDLLLQGKWNEEEKAEISSNAVQSVGNS